MDFSALLRAKKAQKNEPPPREPKRERRNNNSNNNNKHNKRDSQNDHHRSAFERLQEHALTRAKEPKKKGYTIALLFMCIDELPFEDIWRKWMDDVESGVTVKVWVHAKYPEKVKSEWVRSNLLSYSHRPEWGSIELVKAAVSLVHEALKDPDPSRFCLISESCLPVVSLRAAAKSLWKQDRSWLDAQNRANNGYSQQAQFQRAGAGFAKHHLWKADQWFMLTRAHAQLMNDVDRHLPSEAWQYFSKMSAADEMYYPSMMATMGLLKRGPQDEAKAKASKKKGVSDESNLMFEDESTEEKQTEEKNEAAVEENAVEENAAASEDAADADADADGVLRRKQTYVDWSISPKNPATFDELRPAFALALKEGCIFCRKFKRKAGVVDLATWSAWQDELPQDLPPMEAIEDVVEEEDEEKREREKEDDGRDGGRGGYGRGRDGGRDGGGDEGGGGRGRRSRSRDRGRDRSRSRSRDRGRGRESGKGRGHSRDRDHGGDSGRDRDGYDRDDGGRGGYNRDSGKGRGDDQGYDGGGYDGGRGRDRDYGKGNGGYGGGGGDGYGGYGGGGKGGGGGGYGGYDGGGGRRRNDYSGGGGRNNNRRW
jgi:hypothetical protein